MRITIAGTGYVGLTTAVLLAYIGHDVTGVDVDEKKLKLLNEGKSPIHEAGIEPLLISLGSRLHFTNDLRAAAREADVIMIAVGTPEKMNGEADTQYVEAASRTVAEGLVEGRAYTIVVKSTVPIGTNRRVAHVIQRTLDESGKAVRFAVASNPEFLREGLALYDSFYPDRIVIGAEDELAVDMLSRMYRPILEQTFDPPDVIPRREGYGLPPLITTDAISAEMIKYAANAFLALKISFINEIALLSEKVGADIRIVAEGIGLDRRIGTSFLKAGVGWGGSCFPKDTAALVATGEQYGLKMSIVAAARDVNTRQRYRVIEKLLDELKTLKGKNIALLGLSFKPNTDDLRESPAYDIAKALLDMGAIVKAFDPIAIPRAQQEWNLDIDYAHSIQHAVLNADAVVLLTDWKEFIDVDWTMLAKSMRYPLFLDGRNVMPTKMVKQAGLRYIGFGVPELWPSQESVVL